MTTAVTYRTSSERPSASVLWRAAGGRRYASALIVDSLGDGMLRPFVLLYAVLVQGMALPSAGLALSLGFVAGLVTLPFAGRWLDAGARQGVVATALTASRALRNAGMGVGAFAATLAIAGADVMRISRLSPRWPMSSQPSP